MNLTAALAAERVVYVVRGRPGQNDRPALPAGHPITWGLLTEGTVLEGLAYPVPLLGNGPLKIKRGD